MLSAILSWLNAHADTANILLVFLMGVAWRIGVLAQRREDFDFAEMLRDELGKASALRLGVLGSFAVSSWTLVHEALATGSIEPQLYWAYLATWSGAMVFIKAVDKWEGKLPWTK